MIPNKIIFKLRLTLILLAYSILPLVIIYGQKIQFNIATTIKWMKETFYYFWLYFKIYSEMIEVSRQTNSSQRPLLFSFQMLIRFNGVMKCSFRCFSDKKNVQRLNLQTTNMPSKWFSFSDALSQTLKYYLVFGTQKVVCRQLIKYKFNIWGD